MFRQRVNVVVMAYEGSEEVAFLVGVDVITDTQCVRGKQKIRHAWDIQEVWQGGKRIPEETLDNELREQIREAALDQALDRQETISLADNVPTTDLAQELYAAYNSDNMYASLDIQEASEQTRWNNVAELVKAKQHNRHEDED